MAKQSWRAWPDPVVGQAGEYEQWRGGSPSPSFYEEFSAAGRYSDDLLRSLNGRNPDLLDAAEEVAAEQRVQIVLVSRTPHLPAALLAGLRQTAVTPASGRKASGCWRQRPARQTPRRARRAHPLRRQRVMRPATCLPGWAAATPTSCSTWWRTAPAGAPKTRSGWRSCARWVRRSCRWW